MQLHVKRVGDVAIVAYASTPALAAAYGAVSAAHPYARFVWQHSGLSFAAAVDAALGGLRGRYTMPLVDELVWVGDVDLGDVAGALGRHVPGDDGTFQLRLGRAYVHGDAIPGGRVLEGPPQLPPAATGGGATNSSSSSASPARTLLCFPWSPALEGVNADFYYFASVDAGVFPAERLRAEWRALGPGIGHPGELEGGWYASMSRYGPGCVHLYYDAAAVVNIESGTHVRPDAGGLAVGADVRAVWSQAAEVEAADVLRGVRYDVARLDGLVVSAGHMDAELLRVEPAASAGAQPSAG
jgi:hypothetical protein